MNIDGMCVGVFDMKFFFWVWFDSFMIMNVYIGKVCSKMFFCWFCIIYDILGKFCLRI